MKLHRARIGVGERPRKSAAFPAVSVLLGRAFVVIRKLYEPTRYPS